MGFIYKIEIYNQIYIGSTKQKLNKRQITHNQGLNNPNDRNYNIYLYRFCREKKVEKIICELIEEVNNNELVLLEQEYINKLQPTLNTRGAYRTEEQKLLDRKEHNNKKSKCPICGLEMLKTSINRHIKNIHQ